MRFFFLLWSQFLIKCFDFMFAHVRAVFACVTLHLPWNPSHRTHTTMHPVPFHWHPVLIPFIFYFVLSLSPNTAINSPWGFFETDFVTCCPCHHSKANPYLLAVHFTFHSLPTHSNSHPHHRVMPLSVNSLCESIVTSFQTNSCFFSLMPKNKLLALPLLGWFLSL